MHASMKRLALAGGVLACVLPFASPASAADWGGFYGGGSLGYGWGKADTSFKVDGPIPTPLDPSTLTPKPKGGLLGVQVGYAWQSGNLVYGAEADFSLSGMKDKDKTAHFTAGGPPPPGSKMESKQEIDWLSTLRARLGYAPAGDWLIYGTGGPALGHIKSKATLESPFIGYPGSESGTRWGWTAGAGAEWAMSRAASFKFEYLHYDLGSASDRGNPVPSGPPFQTKYVWDAKGNILRAGVNFRF